jgi:hypothetical protein
MEQGVVIAAGQALPFPRLPESVAGIVAAGGLISYLKQLDNR